MPARHRAYHAGKGLIALRRESGAARDVMIRGTGISPRHGVALGRSQG